MTLGCSCLIGAGMETYQLIGLIGEGGYAKVYKAQSIKDYCDEDTCSDSLAATEYAIKVFPLLLFYVAGFMLQSVYLRDLLFGYFCIISFSSQILWILLDCHNNEVNLTILVFMDATRFMTLLCHSRYCS